MASDDKMAHQAAILLMSMGKEGASEVLKMLTPKQVEKVIAAMQALEDVSEKDMVETLNNFLTESNDKTGMALNAKTYIKDALVDAVGERKASSLLDKSRLEEKAEVLDSLNWQPAQVIADLLQHEHPQVITIIFTYLDEEKAANVLEFLPRGLTSEVVKRLSHIGPISPIALDELEKMLESVMLNSVNFRELPLGGVDTAAKIINHLNSDLENEVMSHINEFDQQLSEKIRDRMFPFDKLTAIDDRSLQTLLREISSDVLAVALKGVDEKGREVFLRNMSGRAADMLRDDLEAMGPVQLSKVEAAQKEIVNIAQKLGKEGTIMLNSDSGDMVM
ncbi:MAG: flagellar motor switch protein FliG [Legionellales bacterium]|nr:flagellar motor switch protein FliG [Legionellales bacterium]